MTAKRGRLRRNRIPERSDRYRFPLGISLAFVLRRAGRPLPAGRSPSGPPHTYSRSVGVRRSINGSSNSLARAALPSMLTDSAKRPRHCAAIIHRGYQSLDLLNTTDTDYSHLTSLPTSPPFSEAQKREWRLFSFGFFTSFVGTEIRVTNVYKKIGHHAMFPRSIKTPFKKIK